MLDDFLRYDFGYDWPWTLGHALAAGFGLAAGWPGAPAGGGSASPWRRWPSGA